MECERLNRLVRAWYIQVQDESLAPARMVEFMEMHLEGCDDCLADPNVRGEVKKITELVLPPSKMTKPVKSAKPRDEAPSGDTIGSVETEEDSTDDRDEDKDYVENEDDCDETIDVPIPEE